MKTYTTNSVTQTYAKGFDTEVEKMEERNYFKGKTWNLGAEKPGLKPESFLN